MKWKTFLFSDNKKLSKTGKFSSFYVAKNVLLLYLCIAFPPFF